MVVVSDNILYIVDGDARSLHLMSDTMNLNVRISGSLKDFVYHEIQQGAYENVSEYVRDLIRRDKAQAEQRAFESLKAELKLAFAAPETDYIEISASDITGNLVPK